MLKTRCPHCGTAFRVKPEQLRLRGGRVRCGHCHAPFSALESLIDSPEEGQPVAPQTPEPEPASAPVSTLPPKPAPAPESTSTPAPAQPVHQDPFVLAPPSALPEPSPATRDPFRSSWAPPPQREPFIAASHEDLAPPLVDLSPAAPDPLGTHLDFDLDAPESEPAPAPEPEPEPEPESALPVESIVTPDFRSVDTGEETILAWDWHIDEAKPENSLPLEEEERQEPRGQSEIESGRSPFPQSEPPPAEPVFVSSLTAQGSTSEDDWENVSPGEPSIIEEDTIFEAPEKVADAFVKQAEPLREPSLAPSGSPAPTAPVFSARDDMEEQPDAHSFVWDLEHEAPPRRWPWVLGILILAITASAQGLLLMRHDIAQKFPALRPAFEQACTHIGCAMPWPRVADQISIEAHDLHPRPRHPDTYELTGTLRNRADFAQAYPYLEFTLTDNFSRALVRKVLSPEQWLPLSLRNSKAFDPSSDLAFTVHFEASEQPASGYTISVFYP